MILFPRTNLLTLTRELNRDLMNDSGLVCLLAHSLIVTGFLRVMEALMMSEPGILSLCLFDLVS